MNSDFLNLNQRDWLKGLAVAVLASVINTVYQLIFTGGFANFNVDELLKAAVLAGLAYVSKNLLTDYNGDIKIGRFKI